jgi:hypothetical protein
MITDKGFAERWAVRGDDRWSIVRQVYADWPTPLGAEDGISTDRITAAEERLRVRLPAALREWYEMAGARDDLRGRGNHLLTPERLRVDDEDGMLIFYQENQCSCQWGLNLKDPRSATLRGSGFDVVALARLPRAALRGAKDVGQHGRAQRYGRSVGLAGHEIGGGARQGRSESGSRAAATDRAPPRTDIGATSD